MEKNMGNEMETEARLGRLGIGRRNLNAWNWVLGLTMLPLHKVYHGIR